MTETVERRAVAIPTQGERIVTESVGEVLVSRTQTVDARQIMAYAAAVGADDEIFLDDARAGGIVAVPGFVSSLDWPLLLDHRYLSAIGVGAERLFDTLLHAYQDALFFDDIVPDTEIESELTLAEVRPIRSGVLVVTRIRGRNTRTGRPTHETWYGSLFRNATCDGGKVALQAPAPPDISFDAPECCSALPIPRQLPHIYSECGRIWNPIHTERSFALRSGFPDIVLHGSCTWAFAGQTILAQGGYSSIRLRRLSARFSAIVVPGQTLTIKQRASNPTGVSRFSVLGSDGVPVLTHGFAVFDRRDEILPPLPAS